MSGIRTLQYIMLCVDDLLTELNQEAVVVECALVCMCYMEKAEYAQKHPGTKTALNPDCHVN